MGSVAGCPPPRAAALEENSARRGPGASRPGQSLPSADASGRRGRWKLLTISACWLSSAAPASWSPLSGRAWTSPSVASARPPLGLLPPPPGRSGPRSPPAPLPTRPPARARPRRGPSAAAQVTDLHPRPGSRSLPRAGPALRVAPLLPGPKEKRKKGNGLSGRGAAGEAGWGCARRRGWLGVGGGDRRPRQHKFLLSAQLSRLQCLPPVCLLSSSFLGASWKMSSPPPPPPCYPPTPFGGWKNNFGAPRGVRAWKWRWPPAPSCQQGGKKCE